MSYNASRIGPELDRRLQSSRPDEQLQVIVLLALSDVHMPTDPATRRALRTETATRMRKAAADLLPAIDEITREHGGERLSEIPTVLGTLAVETTPAGVRALAELPAVEAVLTNQELDLRRL